MKLVTKTASILTLACLPFIATDAHAVTLTQVTGGVSFLGGAYYVGQGFTVTGAGSFTNVSFNFFSDIQEHSPAPVALGTAFLFSTLYNGTVGALSTESQNYLGYLGQATADGGFYNFGSSVTLAAGSRFFLYTNALFPTHSITGGQISPRDEFAYFTSSADFGFHFHGIREAGSNNTNFRVTGDAVSVPDGGSTALLVALPLFGLLLWRRRQPDL